MKSIQDIVTNQQITEDINYDTVISKLQEAKENNIPLEEGILGAIVGGTVGLTMGPAIMKAVCKCLGVDEKGQFGQLLTSRLMLTALGTYMGWKK